MEMSETGPAFAININKYDNSDIRDCFVEMLQDKMRKSVLKQ